MSLSCVSSAADLIVKTLLFAFSSAIRGDLLGLPKKGDYVTVRKYSTSICDTYVRLKISWGGRWTMTQATIPALLD